MAKKTLRNVVGARLLAPNGGLVFCDTCEKIVGSINAVGYKYLNLFFLCTCGNFGSVEIISGGNKNDITNHLNRMPKERNGVCMCKRCEKPLLSMIDERLRNYSFYIQCRCGEKYDTKPNFNKRLGETLVMFFKSKKQ